MLAILLKSPVLVHNQLQVQGSLLTDITLEIFVDLLVCCDLQKRTQAPLRFTSVLHVVFSIGARCVVIVGSVQKSFTKLILHFLVATILTNG